MSRAIITEQHLHDIADAIIAKGGATGPMTPAQMPGAIQSIQNGRGEEAVPKYLNFFDYDGFCLYSFTKEQALSLTDLPNPPTHEGLIFQSWNYTLEDIKNANCPIDAGANYITDDGKTRFHFTIPYGQKPYHCLRFVQSVANGVEVDWGDGTVETFTETTAVDRYHTYPSAGDYVIKLDVKAGTLSFDGGSASHNVFGPRQGGHSNVFTRRMRKVEIGAGITSIPFASFCYMGCRFTISLPTSITSIADYAFFNSNIKYIVIPRGCSCSGGSTFYGSVNGISFSATMTALPSLASSGLTRVVLPPNVTATPAGFARGCGNLISFSFNEKIESIGHTLFYDAVGISIIKFPKSLLSISTQDFQVSHAYLFDFREHEEIPSLAGINSFQGIQSDAKIVVPDALYDEWIAATNWSDSTIVGHIVKASEYTEAT